MRAGGNGGSVRVSPTLPVTQRHAVDRRSRGADLRTGPVRLVRRTPPSVAGRGACSSLRILRSLPACSRRERNWRLPTASDGAYATRPPTARNPAELPAAPGAPGGRRVCCAARALGRFFKCDALAVLVAGFPVDGEIFLAGGRVQGPGDQVEALQRRLLIREMASGLDAPPSAGPATPVRSAQSTKEVAGITRLIRCRGSSR